MGNFFMTMNYKNIPSSKIHNEEFLALVALAGMLGNGFFRFVWGGIVQNFGFKWAFLIAMLLNIFSFVSIPLAINYYNFYLLSYTKQPFLPLHNYIRIKYIFHHQLNCCYISDKTFHVEECFGIVLFQFGVYGLIFRKHIEFLLCSKILINLLKIVLKAKILFKGAVVS